MGITPLAIAGLTASALSTGVGVVGALKQGQAQAAAARYDAQVKQQNAALALQQGEAAAFQQSREGAQKLALQRATLGASGVDVNSGSALLDQLATAQNTGFDESTTKYNAKLQADGFQDQAALDTSQASSDVLASYLNAGATFLGGASQFAGKWSSWQTSGPVAPRASDPSIDAQYGGVY